MRIITGNLIFVLVVVLNSVELSSQTGPPPENKLVGPFWLTGLEPPPIMKVNYPQNPPLQLRFLRRKVESELMALDEHITLVKRGNLIIGWVYKNPENELVISPLYNMWGNEVGYFQPTNRSVGFNLEFSQRMGVRGPMPLDAPFAQPDGFARCDKPEDKP